MQLFAQAPAAQAGPKPTALPFPAQDATTCTPLAVMMITRQIRFRTLEPCFEGSVTRGMTPQ